MMHCRNRKQLVNPRGRDCLRGRFENDHLNFEVKFTQSALFRESSVLTCAKRKTVCCRI